MQVQEKQYDHMQIVKFKGKRTKRQRLPSPLRLAMDEDLLSHFDVSHLDEHERSATETSGGFDVAITSSPIASMEFMNRTEEEEDMANCLILLAQGHHNTQKPSHHVVAPDQENNNNKKVGLIGSVGFRSRNFEPENRTDLYLYQCKTCNRCFPSFQALGGHRASHKKANTAQEKQAVTNFVNDNDHDHYHDPTTTSTALTLQISSNRALFGTSTRISTNTKCKVHECSICGAEFTSGQALGGHMRRHRSILSTTSTTSSVNRANNIGGGENIESLEAKRHRNVLKLDLNLPAPHEDDHRESKLPFQSKEKVIVFSATNSLVDCHY